jgi:hypothetical protein
VANQKRLKVINLYGPPGVGKSATRAGVFWLMKRYHQSIEEVTEYAKYLVLTHQSERLKEEQLFCLAEQTHRQLILRAQYEYAITDSPLALQPFYASLSERPALVDLALQAQSQFDNINFYLARDLSAVDFEETGRRHDLETAMRIDGEFRQYLTDIGIAFTDIRVDEHTPWRIVDLVSPGLIEQ